jgi:hypothetical protein
MSKIIVNLPRDPNKEVTIQVEGHVGPGCQKLTRAIEQGLGATTNDAQTDEFYQAEVKQRQELENGF